MVGRSKIRKAPTAGPSLHKATVFFSCFFNHEIESFEIWKTIVLGPPNFERSNKISFK